MASRTKYTPEKGQQICSLLAKGMPLKESASVVGLSESTVTHWLAFGQAGRKPFSDFHADVEKARALFVARSLEQIRAGGSDGKDWKATAWILGKLRPVQFGDRVQVHVTTALEEMLDKLRDGLEPSAYNRVLEILGGDSGPPAG